MALPAPFEFTDEEEARAVAWLLRRQASALHLLAGRLPGDEAQRLADQVSDAIAIPSRIDTAADR
jgi:hypothetical protein